MNNNIYFNIYNLFNDMQKEKVIIITLCLLVNNFLKLDHFLCGFFKIYQYLLLCDSLNNSFRTYS